MPTQLTLLGEGLVASALVAVQVTAWVALGAPAARRLARAELRAPLALLVGAAVTSFAYALLTAAGHVTTAILVVAALSLGALAVGGRAAALELRGLLGAYGELAAGRRAALAALGLVGLGAWALAISPPRDADVIRYHLTHIRQIVQDGRWTSIPDYHYALPFGWSLNYLPFERLGLPVGANLLSLALTLVTLALLLRLTRSLGAAGAAAVLALGLVLALQPLALKAATTAHADAYIMFVTATLAALALAPLDRAGALAFGFAACVGFQSRYQDAAVAVAAAVLLLLRVVRRTAPAAAVGWAALGGLGGLVLASPFYVMNWHAFRNPFWPLGSGTSTYADRVVDAYDRGQRGSYALATYEHGVRTLLTDALIFPVPIVAAAALAALLVLPPLRRRLPGFLAFLVVYFLVWAAAQPNLYSRFVLIVAPVVGVAVALALTPVARRLPAAVAWTLALLALFPLAAFDGWYGRDTARLLATGDLAAYHRFTWYYPVLTWVDDHSRPDARGLVLLNAGLSYYLDRPYRRADPMLSGVVDWDAVHGAGDLARVLRRDRYDFVVYDHAEWDIFPGGANVIAAVDAAERQGVLRPAKQFDVQLSLSRIHRTWTPAHVTVYAVAGARHPLTP